MDRSLALVVGALLTAGALVIVRRHGSRRGHTGTRLMQSTAITVFLGLVLTFLLGPLFGGVDPLAVARSAAAIAGFVGAPALILWGFGYGRPSRRPPSAIVIGAGLAVAAVSVAVLQSLRPQ